MLINLFRRRPQTHTAVLQKALGFNEQDLVANQEGLLSKRQRKALWLQQRLLTIIVPLFFIGVWGIAWIILTPPRPIGTTLIVLFFLFELTVLLVRAAVESRRIAKDLASGRVLSADGFAHIIIRQPTWIDRLTLNSWTHYLSFTPAHLFPLTKDLYEAFSDGILYRVYCLPHVHALLSAEVRD
jgi:hypothetical protein